MRVLPLLLFALMAYHSLFAQNATFITVKAGSKIRDALTTADIFYYPQFTKGQVVLRDLTRGEAALNYNRLLDQMLFISPKGDTLALADEKTIRFICIGKDTFYYDRGYVRLIAGNNVVKLAGKQMWLMGEARKLGAHNIPNSTSTITSHTSYSDGGKSFDLLINEDVVLKDVKSYYFGNIYNRFVFADKKNLLLLFPKEQPRIEAYLKENKPDFTNKDDLEKIVRFLEHL